MDKEEKRLKANEYQAKYRSKPENKERAALYDKEYREANQDRLRKYNSAYIRDKRAKAKQAKLEE